MSATPRPSEAPPAPPQKHGIEVNWVQALAGSLAAMSSAVLLSTVGVAGTIIGAAIGSVVATVGSGDLLRHIPIGTILAKAEARLTLRDWEAEGITVLMGKGRGPDEFTSAERRALQNAAEAGATKRRGRPRLPDELLQEVAEHYLLEAEHGRGVIRRLAGHFDRPEPTIRDWISTARNRGMLRPAIPGRPVARTSLRPGPPSR